MSVLFLADKGDLSSCMGSSSGGEEEDRECKKIVKFPLFSITQLLQFLFSCHSCAGLASTRCLECPSKPAHPSAQQVGLLQISQVKPVRSVHISKEELEVSNLRPYLGCTLTDNILVSSHPPAFRTSLRRSSGAGPGEEENQNSWFWGGIVIVPDGMKGLYVCMFCYFFICC